MSAATESAPPPSEPPRSPPRYSLLHLFYVVTLLAVALATGSAVLIAFSLVSIVFWIWVFAGPRRRRAMFWGALVYLPLAAICLLLLAFIPASTTAPECRANLQRIALAIQQYEAAYRAYPPPYLADAGGRPIHSWRVLILPYLEEQELYDEYNLEEPWNGPHNARLAHRMPEVYRCTHPGHDSVEPAPGVPSYFALVGPKTVWPGDRKIRVGHVADGVEQTLCLMEQDGTGINWLEPRDVEFGAATELLTGQNETDRGTHHYNSFLFEDHAHGRFLLYVDGHTQYLADQQDPEDVALLIGRNDGRSLGKTYLPGQARRTHVRPLYANWLRAAAVFLLAFIPLPWVWRQPRARTGEYRLMSVQSD